MRGSPRRCWCTAEHTAPSRRDGRALTPPVGVASVPGVMGTPVTDTGSAPAAPGRGLRRRAGAVLTRARRAPRSRALALVLASAAILTVVAGAPVAIAASPPPASAPALPTPRAPAPTTVPTLAPAPAPAPAPAIPCLATGNNAYLRARLRGALDLDLAWSGPTLQCDGGARPDGRGLRVTIAGPAQADGRRLRFVFGIDDAPEGARVLARPTNLTVIFEGEQRLFATRGNDRCTTDELRPERIGALGGPRRSWRVVARGFCISPATTLAGEARLLVTSFDFASEVTYEDDPAPGTGDRAAGRGAGAP